MTRYLILVILLMPTWSLARCDVAAIVFATQICQSEITLPAEKQGDRKISPERRLKIEKNLLAQRIRALYAEHLLQKESYTPTGQEIQRYVDFLGNARSNDDRHSKEIVDEIEGLLKTYQYTERHRKRLEDTLAVFRRSLEQSRAIKEGDKLRDEDMRKRFGEDAVIKMHGRIKESRKRISENWVARWKMNRALYQKYGGRIIFQQAGIEPIDAYRAQLGDIYKTGKLKIVKAEYADVFDSFKRYLDMGHNYLNGKDKKYFDRPYWETADPEASHQKTIKDLRATPHK